MTDQGAVQSNSTFANWIGGGLAFFLCATTAYLTYKIVNIVGDVPPNLAFVCGQLLGFLTAKLSTMVDWSYGGSSAQKRQGEIIAQQAVTQDRLVAQVAPDSTTTTTTSKGAPATVRPAVPAAIGDVNMEIPPGATAIVHAGALTKPDEVSQPDWDAMTDIDKAAVVLRYAK
jgi:hypothetical protein